MGSHPHSQVAKLLAQQAILTTLRADSTDLPEVYSTQCQAIRSACALAQRVGIPAWSARKPSTWGWRSAWPPGDLRSGPPEVAPRRGT
jgi:hypothetical protein